MTDIKYYWIIRNVTMHDGWKSVADLVFFYFLFCDQCWE